MQRRYKYFVLGRDKSYFVNKLLLFSKEILWNWYENSWIFYWQHICYVCWACSTTESRHSYGTNCVSLLAYLFLYSCEADFIQGPLKKNEAKLARSFTFTFRYIDDVLSINNCKCGDFVDRLYPNELEIKHTTDTVRSASYLDLHLAHDQQGSF